MGQIRLNKAERVPITINTVPKTKKINGRDIVTWSNYIRIAPNEMQKTDDEALLKFLEDYEVKIRYNTELEEALKANNVPYEVEYCKSCGGKVKKISYHPVEVLR